MNLATIGWTPLPEVHATFNANAHTRTVFLRFRDVHVCTVIIGTDDPDEIRRGLDFWQAKLIGRALKSGVKVTGACGDGRFYDEGRQAG